MITRRHIRIKSMQSLYAITNGNKNSMEMEMDFLKQSCHLVEDLYLLELSLFTELWRHSNNQCEIHRKEIRSKENKFHFHKFLNSNYYLNFFGNNKNLIGLTNKRGINHWKNDFEYIQKLYNQIIESNFLEENYNESNNLKNQHKFLLKLFKKFIAPNDKLHAYYEEKNISWIDDIALVNTFILKQIKEKSFIKKPDLRLLKNKINKDEVDFGLKLFEIVVSNDSELQFELEGKTPNWDSERIAKLDNILIKMAISELIYFENIPPKVTLNEYLEIAKEYSTPKSNLFINGVLDRIFKDYEKENRLKKKGRGLI